MARVAGERKVAHVVVSGSYIPPLLVMESQKRTGWRVVLPEQVSCVCLRCPGVSKYAGLTRSAAIVADVLFWSTMQFRPLREITRKGL